MGHMDPKRWPPSAIEPMIAEMERDLSSPHWERAWRYVHARARRLAHPTLGYRFEPDDLTQEVLIILMRPGKLAQIRSLPLASLASNAGATPRAVFLRFLHVIIRRKFRDLLRKVKADRRYRTTDSSADESDPGTPEDQIERIASSGPTVERQAEIAEELANLYRALRDLAARNSSTARKIAELLRKVYTGEDYQRIAERFGRDPDAARLDICRIRAKLRKGIEGGAVPTSSSSRPARSTSKSARPAPYQQSIRRARRGEQADPAPTFVFGQALPSITETTSTSPLPHPDVVEAPENARDGHRPGADARPPAAPTPVSKHRKGQLRS